MGLSDCFGLLSRVDFYSMILFLSRVYDNILLCVTMLANPPTNASSLASLSLSLSRSPPSLPPLYFPSLIPTLLIKTLR